jgi:formylmethanofuran dehydrogenase subunit E
MEHDMGEEARRLDSEPLVLIERFHGHVGPYVVLGYRTGRLAIDRLGVTAFDLMAEVEAGSRPPMSCYVDGVQLGSGCTLGKGNIQMGPGESVEARFTADDGRLLNVRTRDEVLDRLRGPKLDAEGLMRVSRDLISMPEEALFSISEG